MEFPTSEAYARFKSVLGDHARLPHWHELSADVKLLWLALLREPEDCEVLQRLSAIEQKLTEQGERIMATLASFISDVTKYQSDVTAALSRAQTDLDTLKAELANAGLTPEQQAALDTADASLNAADTTASGFDVPAATPAP